LLRVTVGFTLAAHGTQKLFGWFGGLNSGRVLESAKKAGNRATHRSSRALITIASQEPPPRRFISGADAIATAEIADLKAQIEAHRGLSASPRSTRGPLRRVRTHIHSHGAKCV
jgi:hypothetical protein